MTEEGRELLLDKDHSKDKQMFIRECHRSRKRDRTNADGTFMFTNRGPITATYTVGAEGIGTSGKGRAGTYTPAG